MDQHTSTVMAAAFGCSLAFCASRGRQWASASLAWLLSTSAFLGAIGFATMHYYEQQHQTFHMLWLATLASTRLAPMLIGLALISRRNDLETSSVLAVLYSVLFTSVGVLSYGMYHLALYLSPQAIQGIDGALERLEHHDIGTASLQVAEFALLVSLVMFWIRETGEQRSSRLLQGTAAVLAYRSICNTLVGSKPLLPASSFGMVLFILQDGMPLLAGVLMTTLEGASGGRIALPGSHNEKGCA